MQNFIKTIINSVRNWVKGEIKKSKADWNQNDSSADNYVKNRTHWEEDGVVHKLDSKYLPEVGVKSWNDLEDRPFDGEGMVNEYIIKPQFAEFVRPSENSEYVDASYGYYYLDYGKSYFVSIDGMEYEVTIDQTDGVDKWGEFYINNNNILVKLYSYRYIKIYAWDYEGTHSISIYQKVLGTKTLNVNYLPEQLRFGSFESVLFDDTITTNEYGTYRFKTPIELIQGNNYICLINGEKYSGICYYDDYENCVDLRNSEGQILCWIYKDSFSLSTDFFAPSSLYDIKITAQEFRQINETYLPDSVAMDSDIEVVQNNINIVQTATDNAQATADIALANAATAQTTADENAERLLTIGETEFTFPSDTLSSIAGWYSIAYGNGKFVAMSRGKSNNLSNISAYSKDGINWTQTSMPATDRWCSVIYGNGKFVAVGQSDVAAYSEDGINWTQTSMPTFAGWSSVAYGNGKFVAMSNGNGGNTYISNIAAYSEDGINWIQTSIPTSAYWSSVAYGNGRFVAISHNGNSRGNKVVYSEDGINWVTTILPIADWWNSITYGNGKFVIVGGDMYSHSFSKVSFYSKDGVNWVQTSMPDSVCWHSVIYDNGKFIAISSSSHSDINKSNIAAYSKDGINWIQTILPALTKWYSVTYGNGKFVAVTGIGNQIAYSKDGINWIGTYDTITQNNENVAKVVQKIILKNMSSFTLVDSITSYEYNIYMQNGNLISACKADLIAITTPPNKMIYLDGETFDPTGMIVTLYRQDGSSEIIEDYIYEVKDLTQLDIIVSYSEFNNTYSTNIKDILLTDFISAIHSDENKCIESTNGITTIKTEFAFQSTRKSINSCVYYTMPVDTDILNNVTIDDVEVK